MLGPTIVILSQPRTGCHLLAGYLKENGFSFVDEIFNPQVSGIMNAPSHLGGLVEWSRDQFEKVRRKDGIGSVTIIHRSHFDAVIDRYLLNRDEGIYLLKKIFPRPVFVVLNRDDVVAQAVSFVIAKHYENWTSSMKDKQVIPPNFDYGKIAGYANMAMTEWSWMDLRLDIEAMTTSYEMLCTHPEAVLASIEARSGVPISANQKPPYLKQENPIKEKHTEIFKLVHAQRMMPDQVSYRLLEESDQVF